MGGSVGSPPLLPSLAFLLLLLLVLPTINATNNGEDNPPTPTLSGAVPRPSLHEPPTTGRLQITDLWYDWPAGRNMNRIQKQLDDVIYDVEWDNGTSYYYTLPAGSSGNVSCLVRHFPVGIPRPDWLLSSTYLGLSHTDGFLCHVWEKLDFIWYYEDVETHRPVRWDFFDGISSHVITYEVGAQLEDTAWQAPTYCFADNSSNSNSNSNSKDSLRGIVSSIGVNGNDLNLRRLI